jgi:uncharacterized protein YdaU (DUF1376 family)
MSRPWMPFYVGDYLADTQHLTATNTLILPSTVYLLRGNLPDDDQQLANITKLPLDAWLFTARFAGVFHDGWSTNG